ncbi:MAG: nucleotidyltransferase domain-containing protein [Chthoniobacterales bacterium]|nr:nucleotidyltransferase domain-containing protein [Chthoniobacterales bacterium]
METISSSVLDEAVERLVAEFQPEEIYLFGSHAWGTPTADSDLDFFVIVPDTDERPIRRAQRGHRCLRGLAKPKDVLVQTRSEVNRFKHLRASLSHQILHRGRKLYG